MFLVQGANLTEQVCKRFAPRRGTQHRIVEGAVHPVRRDVNVMPQVVHVPQRVHVAVEVEAAVPVQQPHADDAEEFEEEETDDPELPEEWDNSLLPLEWLGALELLPNELLLTPLLLDEDGGTVLDEDEEDSSGVVELELEEAGIFRVVEG